MEKLAANELSPEIAGNSQATGSGNKLKGPSREDVNAASEMSSTDRSAMIGQMVAGLSERLRSDGGSADEWKKLVRSYMVLGKKEDAMKALADARAAYAEKPETLAEFNALASSLGLKENP